MLNLRPPLEYGNRVGTAFAILVYRNEVSTIESRLSDCEKALKFALGADSADMPENYDSVLQACLDRSRTYFEETAKEFYDYIFILEQNEPVLGSGTDENLKSLGIKNPVGIRCAHERLVERFNLDD